MQEASDTETFLDGPTGRFVVCEQIAYFASSSGPAGYLAWGRLTERDARVLSELTLRILSHPREAMLADCSRLSDVERACVGVFDAYGVCTAHAATRQAIVVPRGIAGVLVSGFYQLYQSGYSQQIFNERDDALAWLGKRELAAELRAIDRAIAARLALPEVVANLRAWLHGVTFTGSITLETAARALAVAPRTLQHQLKSAGTSFRKEAQAVRLDRCKLLLGESDTKLEAVAAELGFSAAQHFAHWFREATGASPLAWRQRSR
jgi:AraC-like DNA-binding protein